MSAIANTTPVRIAGVCLNFAEVQGTPSADTPLAQIPKIPFARFMILIYAPIHERSCGNADARGPHDPPEIVEAVMSDDPEEAIKWLSLVHHN